MPELVLALASYTTFRDTIGPIVKERYLIS